MAKQHEDWVDQEDEDEIQSDSASLRLIEHIFNPNDEALMGVCIIPSSSPLRIASAMAMREITNTSRHEWEVLPNGDRRLKRYVPIDELAMKYYLRLSRAQGGKLLEYAVMLAESQELESTGEDFGEFFKGT